MWLILLGFLLILVYYFVKKNNSYWKNLGVPGPKPLPFIGNIGENIIGKKSMGELLSDIYKKYDSYAFVGIYKAGTPCLLIRDPDFIKNITVRDFKHFQNNDLYMDKEVDPIFGRNPFVLTGSEWKNTRAQLSSCFTSGKIKGMYPFLEANSQLMVRFIEKESINSTTMEARELCVKLTLNNVATCAFGVQGKCFDEPHSQFRDLAEKFLSTDNWTGAKMYLLMLFPKLANFMKIKFVPQEVEDRLIGIVRASLNYREKNNIVKNDFLDSFQQLSKTSSLFTELDIVAHAASFFGDGYETSSRVMSFLLFELAANPGVQRKLRDEIKQSFQNNNNTFTYESIQQMVYLDACVNENLRKNAVIHSLLKCCTEKYTYTPSNPDYHKISVTIDTNTSIILPVAALQNDPKYFESPESFLPERFLAEEKINKSVYFPFGEGPRICIGQRFGITQIKVGVAYLIKNFEFKVSPKTQLPLKYDPWFIMLAPVGGLWIDLHKVED